MLMKTAKVQAAGNKSSDAFNSAVSYFSGTSLAGASMFADVVAVVQVMGIIIGCAVVTVRLIHDTIALKRYWKSGNTKDNRKG